MENNLNGTLSDASEQMFRIGGSGNMGGVTMPNESVGGSTVDANSILISMSQNKDKGDNISLDTLSEQEIKKIMKAVENGWASADHYYKNTVEPKIIERTDIYNADERSYKKKFPVLTEGTKWRSRDVQTAAEWLLPGLMEAFVGGNKPVDVQGVDVEDDLKAKKIEEILTYQIERKNSLHSVMKFSIEEALRSNFGLVKLCWKHEEKRTRYAITMPNDDIETALLLQKQEAEGEIEIKKVSPLKDAPDLINVDYDAIKVTANYPDIQYLSPYELRFTPESSNLQKAKFVCHRKIVTGDELKRKEVDGTYKNVSKAIRAGGVTTPTSLESSANNNLITIRRDISDDDLASTFVELKECYVNVDYNNDGIMEKLIVHCVDNVPLRIVNNDFGFIPFYPCCIYYDPNKVFSDRSYEDLIEQQQDLKTALVKQMIINIARQNVGQKVVDADVIDMNALIDGDEIVMANNAERPLGQYVYAIETPQLSPSTMDLLNYCQGEIESQTGSTKYNKGLDSTTLNDTATGISMIMSAADKRAKMIARDIAENFYVPLIKGVIVLDQLYMRDNEIVRLNNVNVPIRKEELNIDYDLVINVGEGAGTREMRIQYLMILINQLVPLLIQQGIADANTVYSAVSELLQEMGLKTTIAALTDPKSPEAVQKAQQAQQAQQEQLAYVQEQEDKKNQVEIFKALAPRISIKYEDLPMSARTQILQMAGLNVDTAEVIAKELLDDSKENIPNNGQQSAEAPEGEGGKVKLPKAKPKTVNGVKEGNVRAYTRKGGDKKDE